MIITIAGVAVLAGLVLTRKDGPYNILLRLRHRLGGPLLCATCTAFWAAVVTGLAIHFLPGIEPFLIPLAAAGYAIPLMALAGVVDL